MRAPSSSDSARLAEALPLWARTPDNGYSARNTGEAGSRDKAKAAPGQGELFPAWRYHAVFTDSPYELAQAEEQHRGHAIIEQLLADLNDGPLAHLPSVIFSLTIFSGF